MITRYLYAIFELNARSLDTWHSEHARNDLTGINECIPDDINLLGIKNGNIGAQINQISLNEVCKHSRNDVNVSVNIEVTKVLNAFSFSFAISDRQWRCQNIKTARSFSDQYGRKAGHQLRTL